MSSIQSNYLEAVLEVAAFHKEKNTKVAAKVVFTNHGGARFAKTRGINKKAEARYDALSTDYNAFIKQGKIGNGHRESNGYHKPGSRKKVH